MKRKTAIERDWNTFLTVYGRIRRRIIKDGGSMEMKLSVKGASAKQKRAPNPRSEQP